MRVGRQTRLHQWSGTGADYSILVSKYGLKAAGLRYVGTRGGIRTGDGPVASRSVRVHRVSCLFSLIIQQLVERGRDS